ncbi:MAG: rod shape-determining protein MreC [Thermoleophilia bacterium]
MATPPDTPLARRRSNVRRGLLAALVVGCLLVFTAYSTEGSGGPLHSVQSTAGSLMAPVQGGATTAVRPLRDGWRWATSLINARDRAASLQQQVNELRTQVAQNQFNAEELTRLKGTAGIGDDYTKDYRPLTAEIWGSSPSPWYHRAVINRGSADGVRVHSPVLAAGDQSGLAGQITQVSSNTSVVTFLSEPRTRVGVTIPQASNAKGILSPGTPGTLQINDIPASKPVSKGQPVITAGYSDLSVPSVFPRGIPVGQVVDAGGNDSDLVQRVQVFPWVHPEDLAYVVVLVPTSQEAIDRTKTP